MAWGFLLVSVLCTAAQSEQDLVSCSAWLGLLFKCCSCSSLWQPVCHLQAAGSSLLAKLAALLAADALKQAGLKDLGSVTVLPLATGMAMMMALLAIKASRCAWWHHLCC